MKYFRKLGFKENVCPTGCGGDIVESGGSTTLVGWFGGPEEDPNHWKSSCTCKQCGFTFMKHWVIKDQSTWYTHEGKIVAGESTCCESSYKHPCDCGGWKVHSISLSGKGGYGFKNYGGRFIPNEPRFWQCTSCNEKFSDHQYGEQFMDENSIIEYALWSELNPKPPPPPSTFRVRESIGMGTVNLSAIAKLTKNK